MKLKLIKYVLLILIILISASYSHTTQRPSDEDEGSPFLELATSFLQETLANQNAGGGGGGGGGAGGGNPGLSGIMTVIGSLMQTDGKSGGGFSGAAQVISTIGSLMANNGGRGGGGGGFDPSIIGNIIEMFTSGGDNSNNPNNNQKRSTGNQDSGFSLETVLNIVSLFMNNNNNQQIDNNNIDGGNDGPTGNSGDGLMSLLPMLVQAVNSFSGSEGDKLHAKHKEHAWVLPPILEKVHIMWDHFSNSELAEALWMKSGVHLIFKGFTGRNGKLDYDKLFQSLHNQSFRRRWIKAATLYLSDWANYIADPAVYRRYIGTAQMMANGFIKSQNYPKECQLDLTKPSETLSNLVDHVTKRHLNAQIASFTYIKPAVSYIKDLFKLGQARGLLQKFNSSELSDKLTDTLNLEVIEPVLKVHRAYRYASYNPQCDKFVLCEINSHDPNERLGLAGFKSDITKFGSMAAAWFISSETGTPFWTLFAVVNEPYNCQARYPNDCTGFHEGEAKVTTEYIHNEL